MPTRLQHPIRKSRFTFVKSSRLQRRAIRYGYRRRSLTRSAVFLVAVDGLAVGTSEVHDTAVSDHRALVVDATPAGGGME
jgi:hypothetical protein